MENNFFEIKNKRLLNFYLKDFLKKYNKEQKKYWYMMILFDTQGKLYNGLNNFEIPGTDTKSGNPETISYILKNKFNSDGELIKVILEF